GEAAATAQQTAAAAAETAAAAVAAAEEAADAAREAAESAAVSQTTQGLLPGELTPEQEAAGLSIEEEQRLRYHGSKLANLPGQADGPQYGGTWQASIEDPGTWNPLGPAGGNTAGHAPRYMNSLVAFPNGDYDPNNYVRPQGDLATGWEAPDPETWVFHVDQEILWQDVAPLNNRPMTMEDIKIGYEALAQAPVQARDFAVVNTIDADEAGRTVSFNLKEPAPYLINVMMTTSHVVVAPELQDNEILETTAIGSGPFTLEEYEPGVRYRMQRNPTYFRKDPRTGMQLPYLDEMIALNTFSTRDAWVAAWATGDTLNIATGDNAQFDEALDLQPDAVIATTAPAPGWQPYVLFKLEEEPWNDVRVRQALSLLMNREDQKNGIYDGLAAAGVGMDWTFFSDENSDFGGREWPWTLEELTNDLGGNALFDAAKGIALLEAAGFNENNPLTFDLDFHNFPLPELRLMELLVDQWNSNSNGAVKATLVPAEWLAWYGKLPGGEFKDLLGHLQYGPAQDPDQYTYGPMHSESPGNFYQINDPDVDEWALAQRTETDPAKREQLWKNILQRDQEQAYRLWLVNPYRTQFRREFMFNHCDTYNAWNPGWAAKGTELTWLHKQLRENPDYYA
ncbi:MAG: ABC transporter substrate-binding protein, partial [Gammaproteobacteria bacterium]|nr:ABC transporter substrate-binding protein [Gammaproteobacteria bacterium]